MILFFKSSVAFLFFRVFLISYASINVCLCKHHSSHLTSAQAGRCYHHFYCTDEETEHGKGRHALKVTKLAGLEALKPRQSSSRDHDLDLYKVKSNLRINLFSRRNIFSSYLLLPTCWYLLYLVV